MSRSCVEVAVVVVGSMVMMVVVGICWCASWEVAVVRFGVLRRRARRFRPKGVGQRSRFGGRESGFCTLLGWASQVRDQWLALAGGFCSRATHVNFQVGCMFIFPSIEELQAWRLGFRAYNCRPWTIHSRFGAFHARVECHLEFIRQLKSLIPSQRLGGMFVRSPTASSWATSDQDHEYPCGVVVCPS